MRRWLGPALGLAPDRVPLSREVHGRPLLDPRLGADASWSHSGDALVVAFARGARVGIDLERERPRPRALALAQRHFAPAEAEWIGAQPPGPVRTRAFLRLWCAKEAVLKAHGRGLAFGLHRLAFAERAGTLALVAADPALGAVAAWHLREFVPRPGFLGAMAWHAR